VSKCLYMWWMNYAINIIDIILCIVGASGHTYVWMQCLVMCYWEQLSNSCCVDKPSSMLVEIIRLDYTNVCHFCWAHTLKLKITSTIFMGADG
jgi:hypothetical protein